VTLQSTQQLPSLLRRESTLRDWMEDPRGMSVLLSLFESISAQMKEMFGGEASAFIGMDPNGFLMDMDLAGLLNFLGTSLAKPPEDIVDELLARVHEND